MELGEQVGRFFTHFVEGADALPRYVRLAANFKIYGPALTHITHPSIVGQIFHNSRVFALVLYQSLPIKFDGVQ